MKNKILITGAAGFIGSHLVDLLLSEGVRPEQLRLIIPKNEPLDNLPDFKFDIIRGDIRDKKLVQKACQGVSIVYHLAARIDFDGQTYEDYKDVNVDATRYLLQACRDQHLKKFIFFSSIGVFGLPASIGDILGWDEEHPKTYTNFYGQSKWEGEQVVIKAHQDWKIPYAIIRPASVYGPREKGPTLALYKAIKNRQFVMIGDGRNKMHYVYVTDLVKAARLAEQSSFKTGDYIIGGKTPTTLKELTTDIAKSLHVTLPNWYIPTTLALGISYIFEFLGNLIGIKLPIFPSRVRTMTTSYYYDISKATKQLKYQPQIGIKEGTKLTGQWYLQNKYI